MTFWGKTNITQQHMYSVRAQVSPLTPNSSVGQPKSSKQGYVLLLDGRSRWQRENSPLLFHIVRRNRKTAVSHSNKLRFLEREKEILETEQRNKLRSLTQNALVASMRRERTQKYKANQRAYSKRRSRWERLKRSPNNILQLVLYFFLCFNA